MTLEQAVAKVDELELEVAYLKSDPRLDLTAEHIEFFANLLVAVASNLNKLAKPDQSVAEATKAARKHAIELKALSLLISIHEERMS